jgi:hypothetical protein
MEVARNIFIQVKGLDSPEAFGALSGDSNVTEMAKRMASCTVNAVGTVILGTMQTKRVKALVFWVQDHRKRQVANGPTMWDGEKLCATIACKEAEHNIEKR